VAARDQPLDERNHLRHELRRSRHERWISLRLERDLESERLRVFDESTCVEVGDRHRIARVDLDSRRQRARLLRLGQTPPCHGHLVFAAAVGIRVVGHVADVRDVHHVLHAMARELERAPQQVRVQERPEVADMGVVVDRRTAGIEEDRRTRPAARLDRLQRARERVGDSNNHGRSGVGGGLRKDEG